MFLFIFQLAVLRQGIDDAIGITVGLVVVILGLMFFMEGLRLGLMPLGKIIGATLPQKAHMWVIIVFAVVLGISVTLAEPAIATLKQAGAGIKAVSAPLLYDPLNEKSTLLVGSAGLGVGIGTTVGVPDGFGMLAMASFGPILSVLLMGLYVSRFSPVEEAPKLWIPLDDDLEPELETEPAQ